MREKLQTLLTGIKPQSGIPTKQKRHPGKDAFLYSTTDLKYQIVQGVVY
jgi:hypothetical protein